MQGLGFRAFRVGGLQCGLSQQSQAQQFSRTSGSEAEADFIPQAGLQSRAEKKSGSPAYEL